MDNLHRIIAALAARNGCGRCQISPNELSKAPVDTLRITVDRNGDTWLEFSEHSSGDDDTWPVED